MWFPLQIYAIVSETLNYLDAKYLSLWGNILQGKKSVKVQFDTILSSDDYNDTTLVDEHVALGILHDRQLTKSKPESIKCWDL